MHRRANPWWRRILRMVVLLVILGGLLTAGYFAVDALADYLGRDKLPAPGVDSAEVQSGSYRVRSGPEVGGLVGDITVDHGSGTFRFQGAADTDLAGIEIVGDAAGRLAVRRDGGPWELGWSDPREPQLVASRRTSTSSTPTTSSRRRGATVTCRSTTARRTFRSQESTRRRCTMMLFDAARYSTDHPFQWNEWVATVLPLPTALDDTLLTVWVDGDGVIRGFDSPAAALRWERVTYSADTVPIEFPLT